MEDRYVPRDFKCAQEAGTGSDILNHNRTVSNLPFIFMVLERFVDARLERYLVINSLHEYYKSAYRLYHSI